AKNTIMLYFRQILIMLVSLYTVRVVLDVLGVVDYGIYNVVAGIVTMFTFLSGAMATACQRYFSFELGRKDYEQLKKTFSVSLISYIVIAVLVLLFAETVGLWFVYNKLDIPVDRVHAARLVYHASVLSLFLTIVTTPYMASIIAHEDMTVYAYVSIVEVLLKLLVPLLLPLFVFDKLVLYGYFLAGVVVISTLIYRKISRKRYEECRSGWYWDKFLFKELISYTGWNMFGSLTKVSKFQAVNIVLNQYYNPVIVASRSIAIQVNNAVKSFAQNFSTAVRPQIIKSYAADKIDEMNLLVFRSCKATFYLMFVFMLPLSLEMTFVLSLWLKSPPQYVVIFTQLILLDALIESVSYPLMTVAQATGKIKLYQVVVGGILLLNLPLSMVAMVLGFSPVSVFIIAVVLTFIAFIFRLIIIKRLIRFSIRDFFIQVILPIIVSSVIGFSFAFLVKYLMNPSFFRTILVVIISVLSFSLVFFYFGLSRNERVRVFHFIKSKTGVR
ncbi:MAG TPA: oligosaccharide flippase family protein, partial [Acholeplasmataceae bacterium]|nr:oligosaccharide flippase family protein [Acholeplasmataceae bacterium]